jgi:hypothetical protein
MIDTSCALKNHAFSERVICLNAGAIIAVPAEIELTRGEAYLGKLPSISCRIRSIAGPGLLPSRYGKACRCALQAPGNGKSTLLKSADLSVPPEYGLERDERNLVGRSRMKSWVSAYR